MVGTGLAGLLTALSLAPLPVVLVTAGQRGSSDLAQGGIAAAIGEGDSSSDHAQDTLSASSGLCDEETVSLVTSLGPDRIRLLGQLGVAFDRDSQTGEYLLGREAAHSAHRILHCNGDGTGAAVTKALWDRVRAADHIQLVSPAYAEQLLLKDGRVAGVELMCSKGSIQLYSQAVILATGGIGQLFARTTNPVSVCGQGLGMAIRAGAKVADLEFVQFHPTAISVGDVTPCPLATEALRGAGAKLIDGNGRLFMETIHRDAELAPRDIVARAVFREAQLGGAYLDAREAVGADFPNKFPTVYELCRQVGVDPITEAVPVAPAAHYHMGGVATDLKGRTSLDGLWACGEVACTGLHGANRLASNSLLEALVFAPIVAEDIKSEWDDGAVMTPAQIPSMSDAPLSVAQVPNWLQKGMYEYLGVVRNEQGMSRMLQKLENWSPSNEQECNMQVAARAITKAALNRRESRGGHFRSDYPLTQDNYQEKASFFKDPAKREKEVSYV